MNLIENRNRTINTAPRSVPTSNIFFASNFSNISQDYGTTTAAYSLYTGIDNDTGSQWTGKSASYPNGGTGNLNCILNGVSLINDYYTVNAATWGILANTSIIMETGPHGNTANILHMELLDAGLLGNGADEAYGAQIWLTFHRIASNTYPLPPDFENLYFSYYFKKPSYIDSMTTGRDILFDLKGGGYANTYGGDIRITGAIQVIPSSNTRCFTLRCDHGANGTMPKTPYGATWPAEAANAGFVYWESNNRSIVAQSNTWYKLEVFIHRAASNGVAVMAINDVVSSVVRGRTIGEYFCPWGRLFIHGVYTDNAKGSTKMTELTIRDYPPANSVINNVILNYLF